jgi:hypothetical protein
MIILIVIVFDPLAVLMLIAANWSLKQNTPIVPTLGPIQKVVLRGPKKEPPVKKPKTEAPKEVVKEVSVKKPKSLRPKIERKWLQKESKQAPEPSKEIFSDGQKAYKSKDLL